MCTVIFLNCFFLAVIRYQPKHIFLSGTSAVGYFSHLTFCLGPGALGKDKKACVLDYAPSLSLIKACIVWLFFVHGSVRDFFSPLLDWDDPLPPCCRPEASQAAGKPGIAANSEVYKMLQENQESNEPPRQSTSFKVLQEILETGMQFGSFWVLSLNYPCFLLYQMTLQDYTYTTHN